MASKYSTIGRIVYENGAFYCEARDAVTAVSIFEMLIERENIRDTSTIELPFDNELPGPLFGGQAHHVRRQQDEYACSCGMRWPADEGEDHP